MKNILYLTIFALTLSACTTVQRLERQQKEKTTGEQVDDSIRQRTFTVDFTYVTPQRMTAHVLTTDYWIRISGDSIDSQLPYFGVAYRADLGQTESPLSFKGHISSYEIVERKSNRRTLRVRTARGIDQLDYYLTIGNTGNASLNVLSTDRESIGFNGEMVIN